MAMNFKSRTGMRARTTTGVRTKSGFGQSCTTNKTGMKVPPAWKNCNNSFFNKFNSFKALYNQTCGAAKHTRPTPAVLNTFANWIDKGAVIQTVSSTQVARWAKNTNKTYNTRSATPTACKNILCTKFGKTTIKAVCKTKTGGFMVATSPTAKGKPFCFPK